MVMRVWAGTKNSSVYEINTNTAAWNAVQLCEEHYYVRDSKGNLTGVSQEGCTLAASLGWTYELFSRQHDTTPEDFRKALSFVKLVANYCEEGFHVRA